MAAEEPHGIPMWIHQLVEYLIAGFLVIEGGRSAHPVVPLLVGLAVVVVAATVDGPLSAARIVPRPLHRVADLVLLIGLVVVVVWSPADLGDTGKVLIVLAAVAMAALLLRTDYRTPARRSRRRGAPAAAAAAAPAPAAPPAAAPTAAPAAPAPPPARSPAPDPAPVSGPAPGPAPAAAKPAGKKVDTDAVSRAAGRALGRGVASFKKKS